MNITDAQLKKILTGNVNYKAWLAPLNQYLAAWDITTIPRICSFLSQTCHESAQYTIVLENLNYGYQGLLNTFPKYFKTLEDAKSYERKPEKIANRVYANRMHNGDEKSGDGWKYRGAGIIQCTGKANHEEFAEYLDRDVDATRAYILTNEGAVHYACFFFKTRGILPLADKEDIVAITKKINGGTIGLDHRAAEYKRIKIILNS